MGGVVKSTAAFVRQIETQSRRKWEKGILKRTGCREVKAPTMPAQKTERLHRDEKKRREKLASTIIAYGIGILEGMSSRPENSRGGEKQKRKRG